jgi:hypothetical protein
MLENAYLNKTSLNISNVNICVHAPLKGLALSSFWVGDSFLHLINYCVITI